jgi:hypothetical protein
MINPAEDIVNLWLQEFKNHFTMTNIYVKKRPRKIKNKTVYGGRGKEIDIVSTDRKQFYWVEVSVSPNPYLPRKSERFKALVSIARSKFNEEKLDFITERFGIKHLNKWYIYSPKIFSKNSKEEVKFCSELKKEGITAWNFENVLKEIREKLNYMGYDVTRNYLYLLKIFN